MQSNTIPKIITAQTKKTKYKVFFNNWEFMVKGCYSYSLNFEIWKKGYIKQIESQ